MTMRLIDADALKKAFATDMRIVLFDGTRQGAGGFLVQRYQVVGLIDEAPTVDVAHVVHARWKQGYELVRGMEDNSELPYVACSNCGQTEYGADLEDYTDYDDLPNYCPNCGAKMDGKE
jgi:hypothetical protein